MMMQWPSFLRHQAARLCDILLPPTCLSCRIPVSEQGVLCATCWSRLTFITTPQCSFCGTPFMLDNEAHLLGAEHDLLASMQDNDTLCGNCLKHRPRYARARAALVYDDAARPLVTGFKYGDRLHGAKRWAGWMQRAGTDILVKSDLLIPVPLHPWRLLRRRYNQAAELARALSELTGIPTLPDGLLRIRATPPQQGLSRKARRSNIRGAFAIHEKRRAQIEGLTLLLIDDVLTTGATVEECARILYAAGAQEVHVLTLARVLPK